jgi:hypothetical protein
MTKEKEADQIDVYDLRKWNCIDSVDLIQKLVSNEVTKYVSLQAFSAEGYSFFEFNDKSAFCTLVEDPIPSFSESHDFGNSDFEGLYLFFSR